MTTNFFENIVNIQVRGTYKMVLHIDEKDEVSIAVIYTADAMSDDAAKKVPPMSLKGKAVELDAQFFDAIENPIKQTAELFQNMEAYMKGLEEAKRLSKMEADKHKPKPTTIPKPQANKEDIEIAEPKVDKEAKKKAFEEVMKKVSDFNDHCKYEEALAILPTVAEYPEKQVELDKKRADLTRKKEQLLQLF